VFPPEIEGSVASGKGGIGRGKKTIGEESKKAVFILSIAVKV
jgi:hypothetical protein